MGTSVGERGVTAIAAKSKHLSRVASRAALGLKKRPYRWRLGKSSESDFDLGVEVSVFMRSNNPSDRNLGSINKTLEFSLPPSFSLAST
jgi:hypothetical protein